MNCFFNFLVGFGKSILANFKMAQTQGSQVHPDLGLLSVPRFTCAPHVYKGSFGVLWFHPTVQKHVSRQTGHFTSPFLV